MNGQFYVQVCRVSSVVLFIHTHISLRDIICTCRLFSIMDIAPVRYPILTYMYACSSTLVGFTG